MDAARRATESSASARRNAAASSGIDREEMERHDAVGGQTHVESVAVTPLEPDVAVEGAGGSEAPVELMGESPASPDRHLSGDAGKKEAGPGEALDHDLAEGLGDGGGVDEHVEAPVQRAHVVDEPGELDLAGDA